ncbi:hypothetical protein DSECCO2_185840 [anaerobic digester metagenome]
MVSIDRLTLAISLAPKYWAMMMVEPEAMPMIKETSMKISGNEAPTAASASLPRNLPTMMLSVTLYNCWKTLPKSMGVANLRINPAGRPVVRSCIDTHDFNPVFNFNFQ